ncbi:cytochrome c biogenesis protein ResB [Branchiibius sp. NY16-3462-2]|uniref:cytochrome c biogenesis protein ResB n=1 Tax=Branchiibius sp. NY16-3462-2 TaxID=1807500 RepID=UPI00079C1A92|nr:cytochrome c biogenesis protein ResB [Branchiibius sp. NY16-3462-2]KYH46218.1 cytochrome C biogenesis protein [Branchiibius sp. NY16-3462-2]
MATTTTASKKNPIQQPKLGFWGGLRWFWRQLTSMRTALFLLLILAVAAVPGSIFPQRGINASRTAQWIADHPTAGPWLDRFGFFDVYSSVWFSAIYLLLIVSLLGCVIPRVKQHVQILRSPLPKVPARITRLPASNTAEIDGDVASIKDRAYGVLRRKRYRVRSEDTALAAEGGRLRETGNLLFHLCLVIIIIGVALGHLLGWRGDVIVPVGTSFSNTTTRYDTLSGGPWVDLDELTPWTLKVDQLDVSFESGVPSTSAQWGQPRDFTAHVTTTLPGATPKQQTIAVNEPLSIEGSNVYLLGNGYAPHVTVKDAKGKVIYDQETPFLPQDNMYKSTGAIKVPAASPKQLGFFGFFLPTYAFDNAAGPISTWPGLAKPALVLGLYEGDLFPNGLPQSVYTLDTSKMTQVKDTDGQPLRILVQPGQTVTLPGGRGSITLDDVPRWAGLSVRHDPASKWVLAGALLGLAGLIMSMTLRRRRIFFTFEPAPGSTPDAPRTLVTIGGLAKGDDPRLQVALDSLLDTVRGEPADTSKGAKA